MKIKSILFLLTIIFILSAYLFIVYLKIPGLYLFEATESVVRVLNIFKNSNTQYEVIFVGNSKTKYQIDPQIGLQHGVKSFNMGIDGFYYPFWPIILKELPANKVIIFSLDTHTLYQPFLPMHLDNYATLTSLPFLYNTANFNYLFQYTKAAINNFKLSFYLLTNLWIAHPKTTATKCVLAGSNKILKQYTCPDNSAFLISVSYPKKNTKTIFLNKKNLNIEIIDYLNKLIDYAHSKNMQVGIILVPHFNYDYHFDYQLLASNLHAPILDLSHLLINEPQYWEGGAAHLNINGRKLYSEQVYNWISKQYKFKPSLAMSKQN